VSGERANRTRLDNETAAKVFEGSTMTGDGFVLRMKVPAETWPADASPEFVYPQSTSPWTEPRCAVDKVTPQSDGTSLVAMKQPCWSNLLYGKGAGQRVKGPPVGDPRSVGYIENIGRANIVAPGEWYIDEKAAKVYYAMHRDETAADLEAELPVLESLIEGDKAEHIKRTAGLLHDSRGAIGGRRAPVG
jgi:hypothetical protein